MPEIVAPGARLGEKRRTLLGRSRERGMDDRFDAAPSDGVVGHGTFAFSSSTQFSTMVRPGRVPGPLRSLAGMRNRWPSADTA